MRKKELFRNFVELQEELNKTKQEYDEILIELEKIKCINKDLKKQLEEKEEIKEVVSVPQKRDISRNVEVQLTPEEEFGAEIIGRIIVSATQHANELSIDGDSKNLELINLILGRTEVEKANILQIVFSEADFEVKKSMMLSCENEALEYFESIMAQR